MFVFDAFDPSQIGKVKSIHDVSDISECPPLEGENVVRFTEGEVLDCTNYDGTPRPFSEVEENWDVLIFDGKYLLRFESNPADNVGAPQSAE
jgi:hypothetical protein